MTPEQYQQIGELCYEALQLEPDQRKAFLDQACAEDQALRQEVESLLSYQQEAEDSFDTPALEVAARLLAKGQAMPTNASATSTTKLLNDDPTVVVP